ncbi:unnamed protein product, partial [Cuscuta campestris]
MEAWEKGRSGAAIYRGGSPTSEQTGGRQPARRRAAGIHWNLLTAGRRRQAGRQAAACQPASALLRCLLSFSPPPPSDWRPGRLPPARSPVRPPKSADATLLKILFQTFFPSAPTSNSAPF